MKAISLQRVDFSILSCALKIPCAALFIGLCAQITVPLRPVPLTGQTFGLLLTASFLGKRQGAIAALCYLLSASLGAPFLAGGASGFSCFMGPTAGYLLSYPLEAFCFGWLMEQRHFSFHKLFVLGNVIAWAQLALGSLWLCAYIGINKAFALGFTPFIALESLKVLAVIQTNKKTKV